MQSCHLMRRWALLIILVLLGASLSGCQELFKGPDPTLVDFHNVLTDPVVRIQRLDTDGDEDEKKPEERQREWVVFYQRGGVIFGTVYDVQGDPPVIFPYSLEAPDQDFLGQATGRAEDIAASMENAISLLGGQELVIRDRDKQVTIFRWEAPDDIKPWDMPDPARQRYRCLGLFRTNGWVRLETDRVVTLQNLLGERSRFAILRAYIPVDGSYLIGNQTVEPTLATVDFANGGFPDVRNSPYPEQLVLAFYKTIGKKDPPFPITDYLSKEAKKKFEEETLDWGCPWPLDTWKRVLVAEIRYTPEGENEQVIKAQTTGQEATGGATVTVNIECIPREEEEEHLRRQITWWFTVSPEGIWRMDRAQ